MNKCEQCGKPIDGFHVVLAYDTGDQQFCDNECLGLHIEARRFGIMNKRDLKADLEYCKKAHFDGRWLHTPMDFIDKAYKGWPHAIERAMRAETLVRELVGVIDDLRRQINECGLDGEMWEVYRTAKEVLENEIQRRED